MMEGVPEGTLSQLKIDMMQLVNAYCMGAARPYQTDFITPIAPPQQPGAYGIYSAAHVPYHQYDIQLSPSVSHYQQRHQYAPHIPQRGTLYIPCTHYSQ